MNTKEEPMEISSKEEPMEVSSKAEARTEYERRKQKRKKRYKAGMLYCEWYDKAIDRVLSLHPDVQPDTKALMHAIMTAGAFVAESMS